MNSIIKTHIKELLSDIGQDVDSLRPDDARDLEARLVDIINRLRTPGAVWSPRFERVGDDD